MGKGAQPFQEQTRTTPRENRNFPGMTGQRWPVEFELCGEKSGTFRDEQIPGAARWEKRDAPSR